MSVVIDPPLLLAVGLLSVGVLPKQPRIFGPCYLAELNLIGRHYSISVIEITRFKYYLVKWD